MVMLTDADWLFFTVTLEGLNATVANPAFGFAVSITAFGLLITPSVASAGSGSGSSVYVIAFPVPGRLVIVIVFVAGPAWLSPRESLLGVISAFASIAARMSSIPAPCRCTLSRPTAGLTF